MVNEQGKPVDSKNLEHVSSKGEMACLTTKDLVVRSDRRLVKAVHRNMTGLIFMCNKQTMRECYHHCLFGLPYNMWHLVRQVVPGTILFLFEYEERKMRGIYEATTDGKLNIEKSPYSTRSFPAQVRFKEVEHCPCLDEDEFRDAIEENYFSPLKFHFNLSYKQVQKLCEAFLRKSAFQSKYNLHGLRALEVEEYVPADVASEVPLSEGTQCMHLAVDYHLGINKGQGDSCLQGHTSLRCLELSHYPLFDSPFSDRWLQSNVIGVLGSSFFESCSDSCQSERLDRFSCLPFKRSLKCLDHPDGGSQFDLMTTRPAKVHQRINLMPAAEQLGIHTDGLDLGDYSSGLHADRLSYKPSVWSRISARVVDEEDLSENVETNNAEVEGSYHHVTSVDGIMCRSGLFNYPGRVPVEVDNIQVLEVDGVCNVDCINGNSEFHVADTSEVDFPISFKRRKLTEKSGEMNNRRKKINRPDFSDTDKSEKEQETGLDGQVQKQVVGSLPNACFCQLDGPEMQALVMDPADTAKVSELPEIVHKGTNSVELVPSISDSADKMAMQRIEIDLNVPACQYDCEVQYQEPLLHLSHGNMGETWHDQNCYDSKKHEDIGMGNLVVSRV